MRGTAPTRHLVLRNMGVAPPCPTTVLPHLRSILAVIVSDVWVVPFPQMLLPCRGPVGLSKALLWCTLSPSNGSLADYCACVGSYLSRGCKHGCLAGRGLGGWKI